MTFVIAQEAENLKRYPQEVLEAVSASPEVIETVQAATGGGHSEGGLHIVFVPDVVAQIGSFPITNSFVGSIVATLLLAIVAFVLGRKITKTGTPGKLQNFFEGLFDFILSYMEDVLESRKKAVAVFPLIATLFLFIWIANWLEFIPGFGSIIIGEAHLLRGANTDLNMTLALTIVAFVTIEALGFRSLGLGYLKKFFNFSSPINFFVGLIELVSELSRLVSLSFRLFGNIFAGEIVVLLAITLQGLLWSVAKIPFPFPVPVIMFEMGVGVLQAGVFALLTLFFIKMATESHDH